MCTIKSIVIKDEFKNSSFNKNKKITFNQKTTVLYGPNGSGKSITLKTIADLHDPKYKKIDYDSGEYSNYLSFCLDNVYFCGDEVKFEYEYVNLKLLFNKYNISEQQCELLNLDKYLKKLPIQLSHGNRKKLAFLIAINSDKRVILLDEITNGIDNNSLKSVAKMINNCDKQIIMSTHDINFIKLLNEYEIVDY